jgi:hypothetical protein
MARKGQMTTDKVKDTAQSIAFVLAVLFFILLGVGWAFGQEDTGKNTGTFDAKCDHINNSFDRFDAIRLTPMSTVLNLEPVEGGHKLETRTDAKHVTKYTAFTLTKDTAFDAKAIKKGKLVFVLYSICDGHVYAVTRVLDSQIIK